VNQPAFSSCRSCTQSNYFTAMGATGVIARQPRLAVYEDDTFQQEVEIRNNNNDIRGCLLSFQPLPWCPSRRCPPLHIFSLHVRARDLVIFVLLETVNIEASSRRDSCC
jgi:hypothetical protein